ncbi:MAG: ABC transporter ATP-binding protein, partial [Chitinophagaceae bacterium]
HHSSVLFQGTPTPLFICTMIEIKDLTYRYNRKKTLFEGLDLQLMPGKVYGLLGKNGAGKSSLIKNIAGLLLPSQGACLVDGRETSERETGFLEQLFFLPEESELPRLLIPKFLAIYAPFYPGFDKKQFYDNLATFNVDPGSHLQQLSFGQRKKAYIAFALAANTRVLIMDEPTNGLDIPSKIQFRKLVAASKRQNKINIISTHQVRDLDDLITTVLVMDDSKILLHADKEDISAQLFFSTGEQEDPVYEEETTTGLVSMSVNTKNLPSYLDLEVLFNATLKRGPWLDRIKKIGAANKIQPAKETDLPHLAKLPLLFKRQYLENNKLYRIAGLGLAAILLFLFFITWHFRNSFSGGTNQGIFLIGLFLSGSLFTSLLLKDLGQPSSGIWLMALPASISQKLFVCIIFSIVFYVLSFVSIFFMVELLFNKIVGENSVRMEIKDLWKNGFYNFFFIYMNIQLLVLLGSISFKKAAFIKTIIILLVFFLSVNSLNNALLGMITSETAINGGEVFDYFQFVHGDENVYVYLPENWQLILGIIFHYLVPCCIFYITYLKFRETEI